jgi:acetaldehyde dehydrogenase (acetylating)
MAVESAAPQSDKDLASISQARALARAARQAQAQLAELSQEQIDGIVAAMAEAVTPHAEALAQLAVNETGYGVVADKIQKNLFGSRRVYEFIAPMRTVGVINRIDDKKIIEIAEPFGVVAAVVPSTNPTSTAIYKVLIALKARCAIVISPHPAAVRCITRTVEIMAEAATRAGAPPGSIGWMNLVTLEGTQELMKHRDVAVILATGGMGLVRAAYSAGKPAYGVGPGNAPAYLERSADIRKAVRDVITGKTFDHGVLCSSENSVVVDDAIAEEVRREFVAQGGHFLSSADIDVLGKAFVTPQRLPNPTLVGKSATFIAQKTGIDVPDGTRVLIAPLAGVGRDYPLSIEKLAPILSWYVVKDWREGCERCIQILRYGGMGHTMSIHSKNDDVILQFGLKKPAFRICVNTPTTHGSIGLTTGLDPAMTLGCGGWGGNITSDNITPRHLLNVKRLAHEVRPAVVQASQGPGAAPPAGQPTRVLPQPAPRPAADGIPADLLSDRIDRFLSSRGFGYPAAREPRPEPALPPSEAVVDFVAEEDVRAAMKAGRKLRIDEKTIITPSARDLGEAQKIFVYEAWPR